VIAKIFRSWESYGTYFEMNPDGLRSLKTQMFFHIC